MKTKKSFLMGAAFILIAAMVLAGCATTKGSGDPALPLPIPDTPAERLAVDLNAIKAGSATVEGATVKLSDEVQLTTSLTVPAGVTLDLTADGVKFELQNGATLTVDGTITTGGNGDHGNGWVNGGLRIGDGIAVINGSGTIRLQSKGSLLSIGGDKTHLTLDGVTLVGIADNDNGLVQVNGGGEFVMKSGAITGNTTTGSGGGVRINGGSTFTMEGGTISGNTTTSGGGGVNVNGGTFTMEGGAISGNTAKYGGGVEVNNGGSFTMSGSATISGNTASYIGGGVYAGGSTTFTMEGGTISGNSASNGGGVFLDGEGGVFTMQGGTIYGSASNAGDNANKVTGEGAAIGTARGERVVKWGTGGVYTKGGVAQTGGSDIGGSDDTLIATPAP